MRVCEWCGTEIPKSKPGRSVCKPCVLLNKKECDRRASNAYKKRYPEKVAASRKRGRHKDIEEHRRKQREYMKDYRANPAKKEIIAQANKRYRERKRINQHSD